MATTFLKISISQPEEKTVETVSMSCLAHHRAEPVRMKANCYDAMLHFICPTITNEAQ
jgi:hypothetical protein